MRRNTFFDMRPMPKREDLGSEEKARSSYFCCMEPENNPAVYHRRKGASAASQIHRQKSEIRHGTGDGVDSVAYLGEDPV